VHRQWATTDAAAAGLLGERIRRTVVAEDVRPAHPAIR
jgi:hypothetical protein